MNFLDKEYKSENRFGGVCVCVGGGGGWLAIRVSSISSKQKEVRPKKVTRYSLYIIIHKKQTEGVMDRHTYGWTGG